MSQYFLTLNSEEPIEFTVVKENAFYKNGWIEIIPVGWYIKLNGVWKYRNLGINYTPKYLYCRRKDGNLVRSVDKEKLIYKELEPWVTEIINSQPESVLYPLFTDAPEL